jgi:hypothetical protein
MMFIGLNAPNEAGQVYNAVRSAMDHARGMSVTPVPGAEHPGMTVTPIHRGMTVTPIAGMRGLGTMDPGIKRSLTILGALTFVGFALFVVGMDRKKRR